MDVGRIRKLPTMREAEKMKRADGTKPKKKTLVFFLLSGSVNAPPHDKKKGTSRGGTL